MFLSTLEPPGGQNLNTLDFDTYLTYDYFLFCVMASVNGRGVSRILEKLEKSVKDGDYYEAHQMYRTLYFR